MKFLILVWSILLFIGCSNGTLEQELKDTKNLLEKSEQLLTELVNKDYPLVHTVYLTLKPDADQVALISEINKIEAIEVLHDLEIGTFENLEDKRALSDYQLMMSMSFENEADYKTYQAHELHLALKENIVQFLAGPPVTYDYIKK